MGKKVVGIAMGGHSSEREISLESGSTVYRASTAIRQMELLSESWSTTTNWTVVDPQENHLLASISRTFTFPNGR